jgi:hypothetical protein
MSFSLLGEGPLCWNKKMITATNEFSRLTALLTSAPVRERLWAKTCQDLQLFFINAAVAGPAWPLSHADLGAAMTQGWLLPGNYRLDELQDRFAPRYGGNARVPDPDYQVIAATAIEAISGTLRAMLTLPEHDALVALARADGLDFTGLHQQVLAVLGGPLAAWLALQASGSQVLVTADYLREAGRRRVLSAVAHAQERQHLSRSAHANRERYARLLKRWQALSGDLHGGYIFAGSERAGELVAWLKTLPPVDATVFLSHHHPSARTAASEGDLAAWCTALANAPLPVVSAPNPQVYERLRSLFNTLLDIPGYRRITVTADNDKCVRVDIDQFNRVGSLDTHMDFFVNLLLTGLQSRAAIMVRAFQSDTFNVFIPQRGAYSKVGVKHMYGVLLDDGEVRGLSAQAVRRALAKNNPDGERAPLEPSLRCFNWPAAAFANRAGPPDEVST